MKAPKKITIVLVLLVAAGMLLPGCAPQPTAAPTSTPQPTIIPSATPTPTATPVPLPAFSLSPGQSYFSVDGQPGMVYSRNVAAIYNEDFHTLLDWSAAGGTRVIRFGLTNYAGIGGYPYTNTGELNELIVLKWEKLLDNAAAHGIYVLPYFTGWGEWNTTGQNDWANNPLNAANGGPAKNPTEVFQEGNPANTMWFEYVDRLVRRWQGRRNILAWEVLGEANLIQGITERQGIAFVEHMAQVIHAAESPQQQRPITASLGAQEVDAWPNFFDSNAIDFIQTHPYPTDLDRALVRIAHRYQLRYNKPVLIGESGLNWEKPDVLVTSSPNAHIGIQHAIWAGIVSGMMNSRALFWEDAYGIYFPTMRSLWLNQYAEVELPAVRFTSGVDFTGFKPLEVLYQNGTQIWGAAVGNEITALGWFRDTGSEPPDWNLLPVIHGQTVTVLIPGSELNWQVDFYDTKTGNALPGSALLTRQGDHVNVSLPDFTDDIAFKLHVNTTGAVIAPPTPAPQPPAVTLASTDPVAGQWEGTVFGENSNFMAVLNIDIQPGCKVGRPCGKSAFEWCYIDIVLKEIDGDTLVFTDQKVSAASTCAAGGTDSFRLQPDGTILFRHDHGPAGEETYSGILHHK